MTLKRSGVRRRPRDTGPTLDVVSLVWERDLGHCALCGDPTVGTRGLSWSVHHRMARKRGGTSRAFINLPGNLILLHGTGVEGCHGRVEANGRWAVEQGFRVREGVALPAEVPVKHAVHGWVTLADDGTWEAA